MKQRLFDTVLQNNQWSYLLVISSYSSYRLMKTCSSFFATRTHVKSRQIHREHTLQVIKLHQPSQSSPKLHTEPVNIFRDKNNVAGKEDPNSSQFRPVGGLNLFKKLQQSNRDRSDNRKLSKKNNKDNTLRNIVSSNGSRFRKDRLYPEQGVDAQPMKVIREKQKADHHSVMMVQQFLRTHEDYEPQNSASLLKKKMDHSKQTFKSQNQKRPMTSKKGRQQEAWAATQCQQYHDKSAMLNQINFNRPLVEVYGDRYFEYILRNRFKDDFKPRPYVYLLSGKKFSDTKAIAKLRHYRPQIKQREMMVLKGKQVHMVTDEQ